MGIWCDLGVIFEDLHKFGCDFDIVINWLWGWKKTSGSQQVNRNFCPMLFPTRPKQNHKRGLCGLPIIISVTSLDYPGRNTRLLRKESQTATANTTLEWDKHLAAESHFTLQNTHVSMSISAGELGREICDEDMAIVFQAFCRKNMLMSGMKYAAVTSGLILSNHWLVVNGTWLLFSQKYWESSSHLTFIFFRWGLVNHQPDHYP